VNIFNEKLTSRMQKNYLINGPVTGSIVTDILNAINANTDAGGLSFFLGQVRADSIDRKRVIAIEYSAYESMVKVEADEIIKSALEEFDDVKSIDIIHSTGTVKAGEISLLVAVSAGHRKQAIEACSKTVEMIKERLPVWKKEVFEDNSHTWK
jgi:molybdopterin synthase catalytic subunit